MVSKGTYLVSKSVGNSANRAIEIASNVKNSKNETMPKNRFESSTSTYMQDGIYEAMKVLLDADPTVTEGVQIGTTRLPIMVLMTDGDEVIIHTSSIVFCNKYTVTFEPESVPEPDPDLTIPDAGNDTNMFALFVVLITSGTAVFHLFKGKRKRVMF